MARPRKNPEATEEQQSAVAENKQTSSKKESKKLYKLADPAKSFSDRSFSIYNDEQKELPDNPSDEVLRRIKAGAIVEVK